MPTGRRINGSEMFMSGFQRPGRRFCSRSLLETAVTGFAICTGQSRLGSIRRTERELRLLEPPAIAPFLEPAAEAIEIEINDRRGVEREKLREEQAADDRDAEWAAQFAAGACSGGEGQRAEQCRRGRHHDRPKAQQARLINRFLGRAGLRCVPLRARSRSS